MDNFNKEWISAYILKEPDKNRKGAIVLSQVDYLISKFNFIKDKFYIVERRGWRGLNESVGKGGVLVDKDDLELWIKEVSKLDNQKYYNKMSKKAKKWVKETYSELKILDQMANLIVSTVNKTFINKNYNLKI